MKRKALYTTVATGELLCVDGQFLRILGLDPEGQLRTEAVPVCAARGPEDTPCALPAGHEQLDVTYLDAAEHQNLRARLRWSDARVAADA